MDDFQFLTLKCARDNVDFDYELEISNKEYAECIYEFYAMHEVSNDEYKRAIQTIHELIRQEVIQNLIEVAYADDDFKNFLLDKYSHEIDEYYDEISNEKEE